MRRNPIHDLPGASRLTRRDVLRTSLLGAAAKFTAPAFIGEGFLNQAMAASDGPGSADGPIVLVVQLTGGNDGLNTVVPANVSAQNASSIYYDERPNLAVPASSVLNLSDGFGLHPALSSLHSVWGEGDLAIINGVGYNNPNLSHFASTDYWHTAQPNAPVRDGWLGRFFDHQCSGTGGCEPTIGVNIDSRPNLAFFSEEGTAGISMERPDAFRWRDEDYGYQVEDPTMESLYRRATGIDHPLVSGISGTDPALAYVQQAAQSAMISSRTVKCALEAGATTFPTSSKWDDVEDNNYFARRLREIASMINGGLNTEVYYVEQGGYDTHADQIDPNAAIAALGGRHNQLLTELNEGLDAFISEMKAQGNWDRLCIFTVSEFGRKVIENGTNGTDHGAAAPVFVMGGGVNAGLYGSLPNLNEANRIKNDSLAATVDFRQIYKTVLQQWLGVPSGNISQVLQGTPGSLPTIPFLNAFS